MDGIGLPICITPLSRMLMMRTDVHTGNGIHVVRPLRFDARARWAERRLTTLPSPERMQTNEEKALRS